MELSSWIALAVFFAINFAAASSGAIFKPGEWYESLEKPSWNPPNWAFPVVWSVLFCMIAVSGWLVWLEAGVMGAALAFTVYGIQLMLNATWSAIFFGLRRMDWAFYEVWLLWAAIVANIVVFYPHSELAAWLLVPYLMWVTTAMLLNWSVWRLNTNLLNTQQG